MKKQNLFILIILIFTLFGCNNSESAKEENKQEIPNLSEESINESEQVLSSESVEIIPGNTESTAANTGPSNESEQVLSSESIEIISGNTESTAASIGSSIVLPEKLKQFSNNGYERLFNDFVCSTYYKSDTLETEHFDVSSSNVGFGIFSELESLKPVCISTQTPTNNPYVYLEIKDSEGVYSYFFYENGEIYTKQANTIYFLGENLSLVQSVWWGAFYDGAATIIPSEYDGAPITAGEEFLDQKGNKIANLLDYSLNNSYQIFVSVPLYPEEETYLVIKNEEARLTILNEIKFALNNPITKEHGYMGMPISIIISDNNNTFACYLLGDVYDFDYSDPSYKTSDNFYADLRKILFYEAIERMAI